TLAQQNIVLFGSPQIHQYTLRSSSGNINHRHQVIEGVKTKLERLYSETTSDWMREYYETYMSDRECTTCHGRRLNPSALSVLINDKNIYDVSSLQLKELKLWAKGLPIHLSEEENKI